MNKSSIVLRAILALILMVMFYAMAVTAVVGLGYFALKLGGFATEVRVGKLMLVMFIAAIALFFAAGVIAWSVLPRWDRFEPPGPELQRSDCPKLFAEITKVAAATGQREPKHVYLVSDVNAFVTERGGIMGIGSQRVMGIGLPLLELLTVSEFRAVIAHEFGHFYGGDTKLGPWVYKTRAAVGRTVLNLVKAEEFTDDGDGEWISLIFTAIRKPFGWFGALFMRVSQAVSRQQEYSADALAARTVGSDAMTSGLKKVHAGAVAYSIYFNNEVQPLLESGFMPPLIEGLRHVQDVDAVALVTAKALSEELETGEQDPYDSHPPLKERVAAIEALPKQKVGRDDRVAIELLGDHRPFEERIAHDANLTPIAWSEAVEKVYLPSWQEQAQTTARLMGDQTPSDLPNSAAGLNSLLEREFGVHAAYISLDETRSWATGLFGSTLATLLANSGYKVSADPGAPVRCTSGETVVEPFAEVGRYLRGEIPPEEWQAQMAQLGLAQVTIKEASTRTLN
jgi:Zn-dependent protease with chaperone function